MKQIIYTQYEGVQTTDLDTLIQRMNEYMRRHADGHPVGRWERDSGQFFGVVEYTVDERVPETVLERLEQDFGKHYCCECPCLMTDTDKRKKVYPCSIGGCSRTDSPCCEWFYKQLEEGKINP